MNLPIIIIGGGGHAKVLIDALRLRSAEVIGVTDADASRHGQELLGVPIIGGDEAVSQRPAGGVLLVNGIGSTGTPTRRQEVFARFKAKGFSFATVIHPSAVIAPEARLGEGCQIMAGAVIQTGAVIGQNAIVNTGAAIDHDCVIGGHAHVAPGATLCGGVAVGNGTHIGAGATVIQYLTIGQWALIAAGAVVTKDVESGATVAGVPARKL
ncbi:MAG: acetyltransferase [Deltaproteobacteria bacterium]|nr:acetyltransferase [Deltaproteobacteria bacterium]